MTGADSETGGGGISGAASMRSSRVQPRGGAMAGDEMLDCVLAVLRMLAAPSARPGCSPQEIAHSLAMAPDRLEPVLRRLIAEDLVSRDPESHRLRPAPGLLALAQPLWAGPDLAAAALVEMRRLSGLTGETVRLGLARDGGIHTVLSIDGQDPLSLSQEKAPLPVEASAAGLCLLAWSSPEKRRILLGQGSERAEQSNSQAHSQASRARLLTAARTRGYALEEGQLQPGTGSMAAPVLNGAGEPVAALSLSLPLFRMGRDRLEHLGRSLAAAAQAISQQIALAPRPPATQPGLELLTRQPDFHGITPLWFEEDERLVWADRLAPAIRERDASGETRTVLRLDQPVTGLARSAGHGLFAFFGTSALRLSDGRVFTLPGRVMAVAEGGAEDVIFLALEEETSGKGSLARFRPEGTLAVLAPLPGRVSAMARALPEGDLYLAGQESGTIHCFDLQRGRSRLFARIPRAAGQPTALAFSPEGDLWLALAREGGLARLSGNGEIAGRWPLPLRDPTGLCFTGGAGGPVIVTSARLDLSAAELAASPAAGLVLRRAR